jgi:hypothetical protein
MSAPWWHHSHNEDAPPGLLIGGSALLHLRVTAELLNVLNLKGSDYPIDKGAGCHNVTISSGVGDD